MAEHCPDRSKLLFFVQQDLEFEYQPVPVGTRLDVDNGKSDMVQAEY
jgi:hypothetical protein